MVMAEDEGLRSARLQLVANLREVILQIADLSEIAAD
jgi:glycyl-tRNA synthetase beta subunit